MVRNGKTVVIAGSFGALPERMYVEEGAAEAEILFKGVRPKEPETSGRSSFGAIRSIFSRDKAGSRCRGRCCRKSGT